MSHQPERSEKDCLNCGAITIGLYCHVCGQANIVTKQGVVALTRHFVYDIFHFDGKFFDTLRILIFKPGLVAKEYVSGKRTKFLDPIRMYLFTSALFFVVFFSLAKSESFIKNEDKRKPLGKEKRMKLADEYRKELVKTPGDTSLKNAINLLLDTSREVSKTDLKMPPSFTTNGRRYRSVREYNSIQNSLSEKEQDSWIKRLFIKKGIKLSVGNEASETILRSLFDDFVHRIPYMFFLSLPFFALILKLVYLRRKTFYYSDHAVFTLYHYIFSFILLLFIFAVSKLADWSGWSVFTFLMGLLQLIWFFYLYKSMRKFYGQGRGKTIVKFFLVNLCGFIIINLLFMVFLLFSIFQI